jgi:hypothetical protein
MTALGSRWAKDMEETRAALEAANEVYMVSSQVSGHFPRKQDFDDIISESGLKAMIWSIRTEGLLVSRPGWFSGRIFFWAALRLTAAGCSSTRLNDL